jgi:Protein of unknown function (DUF2934)
MAKTARGAAKPNATTEEPNELTESPNLRPTEEDIAVRAYHIYLERGEAGGNPTDDWLQAERELNEDR